METMKAGRAPGLCAAFLLSLCAWIPAAAGEGIEDRLAGLMAGHGTVGLAVVVARDDAVVYSASMGWKDLENRVPLATDVPEATVPKSPVSGAGTMEEAGMVDIRNLVPDMSQAIAYAGADNFVGAPVDGYEAPRCWLKREAAQALARVETALRARQMRLHIFDCYRPVRAVAHFMRWVQDADDQATKATHYPDLDKPQLLDGYIAEVSGHSRGNTVDLTLLRCDHRGAACEPLDMGTGFDFFGSRANTNSAEVDAGQLANRHLLRDAMEAGGFRNYPMEWWHYSLRTGAEPGPLYDVPVR